MPEFLDEMTKSKFAMLPLPIRDFYKDDSETIQKITAQFGTSTMYQVYFPSAFDRWTESMNVWSWEVCYIENDLEKTDA